MIGCRIQGAKPYYWIETAGAARHYGHEAGGDHLDPVEWDGWSRLPGKGSRRQSVGVGLLRDPSTASQGLGKYPYASGRRSGCRIRVDPPRHDDIIRDVETEDPGHQPALLSPSTAELGLRFEGAHS